MTNKNSSNKSNQELIEQKVGEIEVSKQLEVFSNEISQASEMEYYCMDCLVGNTEDGKEGICEACAYL